MQISDLQGYSHNDDYWAASMESDWLRGKLRFSGFALADRATLVSPRVFWSGHADHDPAVASRRWSGCSRRAQQFVDALKESEDGRTFLALELSRDPEELFEERTERAGDDRPPATGGLEDHGAAVTRMRAAGDETFGLEPIGEPGHGAGAHTQRVSEVRAGHAIPVRGTDQGDELGRAQPVLFCLRGEEVLDGASQSPQPQDHLLRGNHRSLLVVAHHTGLGRFGQQ